ncbi:MAG: flagellar hook associated protein [Proteobacteria bacterium]|nr:MAG: flagellar hook associated protein [Pseudomonadota bacterium]
MASISMGGMASGLPKDLVQTLMEAEREPIKQLETRKAHEEAKLKLVQELNTKIGEISSTVKDLTRFRSFKDLTASNSAPNLMDVVVDKSVAEPGDYTIEVTQLSGRSSMMSSGFPDANETQAGSGYFSYKLPNGDEKEVYVDPENSTLEGMAKLINNTRDLDLTAIVVNDGKGEENPYRLIVSHNKSGETNDAEFPTFYFLDGDEDFSMEKDKAAQNSKVKVNGFEVEFEGNKVTTLFPGVTLDLKEAAPGKEINLKIQADTKSIKGKIEGMVGKINEVLGFIQKQNKLDEKSDTKRTLGGDITLQTLEYKVRQLVMTPIQTEFGPVRMAELGVQFSREGTLELKADKFEQKLNENFDAVSQFFVGATDAGDGFANRLDQSIRALTRPQGVVASRVDGIKSRIDDIDTQIDRKERQLARTEQAMKDKFSKLEGTIGKMKAQQTSMAQAMGGG